MHAAALRGHCDPLRILLRLGVDTDLIDECGRTALHYAASYGREKAAYMLVDAGACLLKDKSGMYAHEVADRNGFSTLSDYIKK